MFDRTDLATRPIGRPPSGRLVGRPLGVAMAAVAVLLMVLVAPAAAVPSTTGSSQATLADVRAVTAPFHSIAAAEAAGYAPFYVCTAEPGVGGMGQHFVNGALLGTLDPLRPQALVYRPGPNGYELVAAEYVVFQAGWDATHAAPPELFGHTFGLIPAPNVFGLPPFYQLHVWIWEPNPSGMFNPWNPRVTCPAT